MKKLAAFIFIVFAMTGCNSQVSDFVEGARRAPDSLNLPSTNTASPMAFKVTPGRMNSTTTGGGVIQATITPTQQKLNLGSDMSMTVTFSRNRLTPQ